MLWAEGGKLRYRGPKGVMTPACLAQLQTEKEACLDFLHSAGTYAPLAHGQQALWYIQQSDPANTAYNIPVPLLIHGAQLDISKLRQSLQALVDRHPMLRTIFITHEGQPLQKILHRSALAWEELEASAWPWDTVIAEVHARTQCPFELASGPLFRATLFHRDHALLLLLCAHHIVCDDWSAQVMLEDLRVLYAGITSGALPPLERQYADYVHSQAELLSREGATLAAYWQKQLAGELPVLNLPMDRPRPPVLNLRGATHACQLRPELSRQLKALARAEGVTLYTLLLGAFAVLLHRYTGQDDIIVGSPTSVSRSQREFARTVGYFVNPIPLRLNLTGNPGFRTFLRRAYQTVLEGLAHHAYPFPLLVKELQPQRDPSRSPLFQTMFIFQNLRLDTDAAAPPAADIAFELLETRQMEGQVDLILAMEEAGSADAALVGAFKYHTDLFTAPTIARLAEHWQTLLSGIVAAPDTPVGSLPLLSPFEQQQLLVDWNATARTIPGDPCFHQLFEAQVERTPDATAVVLVRADLPASLTYRELDIRANQLAHHLRELGVGGPLGTETIVGVYAERSLEAVVALLGIWKAGGAYLPLDPAYSRDRLAFMVTDAQSAVIVTQPQLMAGMHALAGNAHLVSLDSSWQSIAAYPAHNPACPVTAGNLAYVIYTSGSTGQPKGALIEHRGLSNLALAQSRAFGVRPTSRVLQVASLNFDASLSEMVMALCCGATLYLAPQSALLPGPPLAQLLEQEAITHVTLTPTTLAVMPPVALPRLHTLIVAGEACAADLVKRWATGRRLFNAYGPTETTVCATIMECTGTSYATGEQAPPIGRPMENVQTYILDRQRQPVPIGVPGELHVGGVGVARGYLNRSALTAEKFIDFGLRLSDCRVEATGGHQNANSKLQVARLYKTGDLARYLPDGNIEFLGRIDQQVKVRGYRIELGEIEERLKTHPGVQDTVVVAQGEGAAKRLVVYWVANPAQPTTTEELRRALAATLPEYMLPSLWVPLDQLPLTPNGKVDRRALTAPPLPQAGEGAVKENFIAPRDAVEQRLATLWAEVLQLPNVSVCADFFQLGGHSLLAVGLLSRIEQHFGQRVPLTTFLQSATVEQIATVLRQKEQSDTARRSPLVAMQPLSSRTTRCALFCIHPVGGNVLCYRDLTRYLGPEHPVYGLQARGLQHGEAPLADIVEMARHYRLAIQTVQPHGPYYLAGWSMGGLIAFEMAQQWIGMGEAIALLALIESHIGRDEQTRASLMEEAQDEERLLTYFCEDLERVTGKPPRLYEAVQHLPLQERLSRIWQEAMGSNDGHDELDLQQAQRCWRVFQANVQAMARYTPRPYPQPLVLFRGDADRADDGLGWRPLAPEGFETHWIQGDHYTILQAPQVQVLAEQLSAYLSKR